MLNRQLVLSFLFILNRLSVQVISHPVRAAMRQHTEVQQQRINGDLTREPRFQIPNKNTSQLPFDPLGHSSAATTQHSCCSNKSRLISIFPI